MHHLNYQHLQYFWTVAREGSVAGAARTLGVTPSTISVQLRLLEAQFDQQLFERRKRGMQLTEVGRVAFRYAESIFSTGEELRDFLRGRRAGQPLRLQIGAPNVFPKHVTWRLIEPATRLDEPCHIVCREASQSELIEALILHQIDVVFSDTPLKTAAGTRLFHHLLGECDVAFFAAPSPTDRLRDGFPASLDGADLALPTVGTEMRRSLDAWFTSVGVRPRIAFEFDDLALLKVAGAHGAGAFPVPEIVADEVMRQYNVRRIGRADGVRERFYAVSAERQIAHPAVVAIASGARELLA
ncbi:MAG: transcriptional activator NhaR [Myxococcales bacterium]|nr:transcriptional activator NhaR [Myxococcales bacterium]